MHKGYEAVYAVVRYDGPSNDPENHFTVKEVVRSIELAEAEVARLNAVNGDKGCRYWWTYTRLFPEGQSASSVLE